MSGNYSGRIHDPNHVLQDYDIYYNDQLVSEGYSATDEVIGLLQRDVTSFTVPEGTAQLGNSAFRECRNLTKVILPDGIEKIFAYGFSNCISITEIFLPASITNISSSVFSGTTALTKIYCGFAQGAVSGAPWSADAGVQILYNQERPEGL